MQNRDIYYKLNLSPLLLYIRDSFNITDQEACEICRLRKIYPPAMIRRHKTLEKEKIIIKDIYRLLKLREISLDIFLLNYKVDVHFIGDVSYHPTLFEVLLKDDIDKELIISLCVEQKESRK